MVCHERVNLLTQKLVTVQWVEPQGGTLVSLYFHTDCFVRWYQDRAAAQAVPEARAQQAPGGMVGRQPEPPPATHPSSRPEAHLTPEEIRRLERLRRRRTPEHLEGRPRPDAAAGHAGQPPEGGDTPGSDLPGADAEERAGGPEDQHQQAPDKDDRHDRHDVPPPQV